MIPARVQRGMMTAQIWDFIESRKGQPFTSRQAIDALPDFAPQSIRTHLHALARSGKLFSERAPRGKVQIYRTVRADGSECAPEFAHVLTTWAARRKTPPQGSD